jgi:hypothetical protein
MEIMHHVVKMWYFSYLPEYIKRISSGVFYVCQNMQMSATRNLMVMKVHGQFKARLRAEDLGILVQLRARTKDPP